MFISAVKLGILTWGSLGIDSVWEPASSGRSVNCSFWHFHTCFIFQPQRLLPGVNIRRYQCFVFNLFFIQVKGSVGINYNYNFTPLSSGIHPSTQVWLYLSKQRVLSPPQFNQNLIFSKH